MTRRRIVQSDASRPGPAALSPGRRVVGAGVPAAPPTRMAKRGFLRPEAGSTDRTAAAGARAAAPIDRELLRVEEVAKVLGIGRSTVFEMIARRELPVLRIGRLVRVPRSILDAWIAERTERAA